MNKLLNFVGLGETQDEESAKPQDTDDAKYDDSGNLTYLKYADANGQTVIKRISYDEQGREIHRQLEDENENVEWVEESSYDNNNARTTIARNSGGYITESYTENLDENGVYDSKRLNHTIYEYNESNQLVAMKQQDPEGKLIASTTYQYETDGTVWANTVKECEGCEETESQRLSKNDFKNLMASLTKPEDEPDQKKELA